MKELKGKVAVVTGGASGIGRALCEQFIDCGMKVVIADVENKALMKTASDLKEKGDVLAVRTDVSKNSHIKRLLKQTLNAYGSVHVLCNNAGVNVSKRVWQYTIDDWNWVLGINLMGTVYAVREFIPVMLKQDEPCHIVNTSSIHGFCSIPFRATYSVSKASIVTLSEILHRELMLLESKINVSVLCPGVVNTKIDVSNRNRAGHVGGIHLPNQPLINKVIQRVVSKVKRTIAPVDPYAAKINCDVDYLEAFQKSLPPERQNAFEPCEPKDIAEQVHEAILNERFYVLPDSFDFAIEHRSQDILNKETPSCFP